MTTYSWPDTSYTTSLFQDHLLKAEDVKPVIHYTQYDYLVSCVLFICYIMFVWLYVSNRKRLNQIIMGLYAGRYANQLAREEVSIGGNRVVIMLSSLFIFSTTLFLYQTSDYFGFLRSRNVFGMFVLISLSVFLLYGIKLLVIRILGLLYETQKEAKEYTISVFLFCNAVGLFLLPIIICLAFFKNVNAVIFIYAGIAIIILFLFTRLIRGLIIGLSSTKISMFYLFLYLCTLEIVPLAIMVKIFLLKSAL